jgi:hypothetical protein
VIVCATLELLGMKDERLGGDELQRGDREANGECCAKGAENDRLEHDTLNH